MNNFPCRRSATDVLASSPGSTAPSERLHWMPTSAPTSTQRSISSGCRRSFKHDQPNFTPRGLVSDNTTFISGSISCQKSPAPKQVGQIAKVTIHNAGKLNTVNAGIMDGLMETFKNLASEPDLRAVVLTGETSNAKFPAFCGGANIYEMAILDSKSTAETFISGIHNVCQAIRDLPAIVVARIHGLTLGAGLEIAAACDFRYATKASIFGMPEVKLGIPSVVEARLLANIIGWQRTRQMVLLGENYPSNRAIEFGLIDECLPDVAELDERIDNVIGILCSNGPRAMKAQKRLVQTWEEHDYDSGIKAGITAFAEMYEDGGVEPKEYMKIFTERKKG